MDRKAIAKQSLSIMDQGYYQYKNERIEIRLDMEHSIHDSFLITPQQADVLLEAYNKSENTVKAKVDVENISTVDAILRLVKEGKQNIGVLNFASAKNPGGGFLNGAMAQEESLAASSKYAVQNIDSTRGVLSKESCAAFYDVHKSCNLFAGCCIF